MMCRVSCWRASRNTSRRTRLPISRSSCMAASPCYGASRTSIALQKLVRRFPGVGAARYRSAVTTNGVLIDEDWLDCFETHGISVAISLDGPAHVHDAHRRTFQGNGTHASVEQAARRLITRDIGVIALAVCNPAHPPEQYSGFFASCGISNYDIM